MYKFNKIKNISMYIISIILILITIIFVVSVIKPNYNYDSKGSFIFGYRPVIVVTGSMEPNIKINSISILKQCSFKNIKVGDIILYDYGNMKITHRVIKNVKNSEGLDYFITKGDANKVADNVQVTADNVEGKLIKTYNNVTGIVGFFITSTGELNVMSISQTILSIMIIVGIIDLVFSRLKLPKNSKSEKDDNKL